MTTTDTAIVTAIVTRNGTPMWRRTETGPRGGASTWYLLRDDGETAPSAWGIWSSTQAQAAEGAMAGSPSPSSAQPCHR